MFIIDFWLNVFANREAKVLEQLSEEDVRFFEQKCPGRDETDRDEISQMLAQGRIATFSTESWRTDLSSRVCGYAYIIPSLFTFFQDVKILQEVAPCMTHMFSLSVSSTVLESIREAFPGTDDDFWDARFHLWRLARASYQSLPVSPRRKSKDLLAKIRPAQATPEALYKFAKAVSGIGFRNDTIQNTLKHAHDKAQLDNILPESSHGTQKPKHRCGFPDELSFSKDKVVLFERLDSDSTLTTTYSIGCWLRAFIQNNPLSCSKQAPLPQNSVESAPRKSPLPDNLRLQSKFYWWNGDGWRTDYVDINHVQVARQEAEEGFLPHVVKEVNGDYKLFRITPDEVKPTTQNPAVFLIPTNHQMDEAFTHRVIQEFLAEQMAVDEPEEDSDTDSDLDEIL